MAGGYTGPLVALDVNDNDFNIANPLEAANKLLQGQAQSGLTGAQTGLTQAQTAEAQARQEQMAAQLPATQAQTALTQAAAKAAIQQTQDSLIARAASRVDPADPQAAAKWDSAMQGAVDAGATDAGQFIGKYNGALQQRVVQTFSAPNPLAAVAASTGGGLPQGGMTPEQAPQFDALFSKQTPAQLQASMQRLDGMRGALQRVIQSPNPAQQWDKEAGALGFQQGVGSYSPLRLQGLWSQIAPLDDYLHSRIAQASAGVPAPIVQQPIKDVNGGLYAIDPNTPGGPQARFLAGQPSVGAQPGAQGQSLTDFANKIVGYENGGGTPGAQNPRSSATGDGQFIDKTWLDMVKANRPDLAKGQSDAAILALRGDPTLSAEMTADYAVKNATTLAGAGQPVNATTLALAHHFGADDAQKILGAAPDAPLSKVLSPKVIAANPDLAGQTAGQYAAGIAQRFGVAPVQIAGLQPGVKPATVGDIAQGGGNVDTHGPDYLKTLAPQMATQVQALADGRMQFPTGMALSKPYWQQMLDAVAQYDPTFNASDYSARAKTRAAFTSGAPAKNITSYNTAIGHLDQLDQSITNLGNTPLSWVNAPAQAIGELVGDPHTKSAIADFNAKKGAAATELVNAFRGSGGAEADIQYWLKQLDQADSPDALHTTVRSAAHLLGSRIEALQDQYNTGMGRSTETVPGLNPNAARVLVKLQNAGAPAALGGGQPAAAPPPVAQRVPGKTYMSPKGPVTWTLNGWQMANAAQ